MNPVRRFLKFSFPRQICRAGFLPILLVCVQSMAQTQSSLTVSFEAFFKGKNLTNGATVQAPATIYLFPNVETTPAAHAGDTVNIDFFSGTNKICSGKAVWRDAIGPSNRPGQFSPMIVARAQFGYTTGDWKDAPVGAHTMTARACGLHGLSAVSAPLHITILPRPGPR
jgi:hypothetical protein